MRGGAFTHSFMNLSPILPRVSWKYLGSAGGTGNQTWIGLQQSIIFIISLSPIGHAHEGLLYSLKVVSIYWKQLAMGWGGWITGITINPTSKIWIFIYFLMILMAYAENYLWTHVYMWKSLGISTYGILNTVFYELLFKSVGMGAQGQKYNHKPHEGEKWCYNRCPIIYEVRRGTWWPKCTMNIERTSQGQERTSLDFSLPKTNERKQRVSSCLRRAYPCSVKNISI